MKKLLLTLLLCCSHWALAASPDLIADATTPDATTPDPTTPDPTAAPPQVISTIHPLTLIAAAITDGVSEPDTLLPVNVSPHIYSLKVSDLRKLLAADLVFWLGPDMERFLEKRMATLEVPQVALLRETGAEDAHGQAPEATDPHIWMDPANAARIARIMAVSLGELDPAHAPRYSENLDRFLVRLEDVDKTTRALLAPYRDQPFFTWHDAYRYLVNHYQLNQAGVVTSHPERLPGTRQIGSMHSRLQAAAPTCLFIEPQFPARRVEQLSASAEGIHVAILDPMGTAIETGPDAYPTYLGQMVGSIVDCLGKTRPASPSADAP